MSDIDRAARTLWHFHSVQDVLAPSDVIVGLGSYDIRVALTCAALFHQGLAPRLIFSGATGNWTHALYGASEAEAFREQALDAGVPDAAITVEPRATNIGENIRFSLDLAPTATSAIFVTKPQTQLRGLATVRQQRPDIRALVTAPATAFEDQPLPHHGYRALLCEMVGDFARFRPYAARGFQTAVAMPPEVCEAFDVLVAAGFTDHLPGPSQQA